MSDVSEYEVSTQSDLQARILFGVPIFRKKFNRHEELKERTLHYFKNKENFRDYSQRPGLLFTSPNLHNEELFKPYTDFILETLKEVLELSGFEPSIALTGMWGTMHPDGGNHHRHTHYNSLLAGVYYLDGGPGSAGTTFFNPSTVHNVIVPRLKDATKFRSFSNVTVPFEEGTLIVFPSWLSHHTATNNLNNTKKYRKILSFNSMPVGPTNIDIFDRYNYADVSYDNSLPSKVVDTANRGEWRDNNIVDNDPFFKGEIKEEGH